MGRLKSGSVSCFVKVRALLVIADDDVRSEITATLNAKYARGDVLAANTIEAAAKLMMDEKFDLIFADAHIGTFFFASFCKEIRLGRLGTHPFPIIFILVRRTEPDLIRKVVDCGPDDILVLPLKPGQIASLLEFFGHSRKPFVVTRDYTGPDQRSAPLDGTEVIPLIPVPNPLAAKIRHVNENVLQQKIDAASKRLSTLRVRRYGVQLRWLANTMTKIINHVGGTNAEVLGFCQKILDVVELVKKAGRGILKGSLMELSDSLSATTREIQTVRGDFSVRLLTDVGTGADAVVAEINLLFPD